MKQWHKWLDMPQHDLTWHRGDMAAELAEYYKAKGVVAKWSELADVVYTSSRARWGGHDIAFPFGRGRLFVGSLYMYPKYTGRYLFFRRAGNRAGTLIPLKEVRNPKKIRKLHHIANKYNLDEAEFERICKKQLRRWPLLP